MAPDLKVNDTRLRNPLFVCFILCSLYLDGDCKQLFPLAVVLYVN